MPRPPAALTREALLQIAGEAAFARGARYAAEGRVRELTVSGSSAEAVVAGTGVYTVRLEAAGDELVAACDCPATADADMCKHAVAVGLAWLGQDEQPTGPDELRAHLLAQPHEHLVDVVLELAERDPGTLVRMRTEAAAAAGTVNVAALRSALTRAIAIRGFVDYRGAGAYTERVGAALDALDALLEAGQAEPVIKLAEHAATRLDIASERIDDSDGGITWLADRIRAQHLEACRRARPDPAALAKRLFQTATGSTLEWFVDAPERYADVLGKTGIAAYRRLAEREWAEVATLPPARQRIFGTYDATRFTITALMESLARAAGDVDELVAVMSRDLSSPYAFVRIAAALADAGRDNDALTWIERGLGAYGAAGDSRLRALAVAEYRRRNEPERAVALTAEAFDEQPSSAAYAELKAAAGETPAWAELRTHALAALQGDALIRAHLIDDDAEVAWLQATHGGASEGMWMILADHRRATHPDDALPVYRRALERELEYANPRGYQSVIDRLEDIQSCLGLAGREAEFAADVWAVREQYRRRPKLMALLDAQGW